MDIDNIEEFIQIDKRIDSAEDQALDCFRESIRDRWEFGKLMLAERKGKQLPKGYLDALAGAISKSRAELGHRMQFAEVYPTDSEVCNALQTFTSWRQVVKSLPKPPDATTKAKPTTAPTLHHKKAAEIIALANQGRTRQQIAEELGVTDRVVRRELELDSFAEAAAAEATPVIWDTIPGTQREKLDRVKASIRKELEKEFRTRLLAELDQYRAKLDSDFAAHKAAYDAENQRFNAVRDDERRRYREVIEINRAKGLITPSEYDLIRSCLHPDSRLSASDEKLAAAFRVFNESRIRTLLVKEDNKT